MHIWVTTMHIWVLLDKTKADIKNKVIYDYNFGLNAEYLCLITGSFLILLLICGISLPDLLIINVHKH